MKFNALCLIMIFFVLAGSPVSAQDATGAFSFPGETMDDWHGFKRHHFQVDGCSCWIAEPPKPLPSRTMVWVMAFPDPYPDRCGELALLSKGFYLSYMNVGNTFGCPDAVKHLQVFHDTVTARGMNPKVVLIGISRGGLYAYNWAAKNPDKVSVIYGDAPVCDFKSWPGGKGKGKGSPNDWAGIIKCYGFKDESEALAYKQNPIDELEPLAKAKVALIHVVGDADDTVPVAENTALLEQKYQALGGEIKVIHKPGCNHHPHGLEDPTPTVDFIIKHAAPDAVTTK